MLSSAKVCSSRQEPLCLLVLLLRRHHRIHPSLTMLISLLLPRILESESACNGTRTSYSDTPLRISLSGGGESLATTSTNRARRKHPTSSSQLPAGAVCQNCEQICDADHTCHANSLRSSRTRRMLARRVALLWGRWSPRGRPPSCVRPQSLLEEMRGKRGVVQRCRAFSLSSVNSTGRDATELFNVSSVQLVECQLDGAR
jgi:hypothetical protein